MKSLYKYLLVLLFAIGLAACDSSDPNFAGTYGQEIFNTMTPRVKIYKKDSHLVASLYNIPEKRWEDPVEAKPVTGLDALPGWGGTHFADKSYKGIYAPGVVFLLAVPKGTRDPRNKLINSGYAAYFPVNRDVISEVTKLD